MEIGLEHIFSKMYCPRCGYEGWPRIKALTYGVLGSVFMFTGVLLFLAGALLSAVLILGSILAVWLLPFGILGLMFCLTALAELLQVCCPRCRYLWAMSLAEFRQKVEEHGFSPPHLLNREHVLDRKGKIIPWT